MTRGIIIAILCCIGWSAHAQYDGEGETISRFRPGAFWFYSGIRPAKPEKPQKYDRLIFDLTYNDWIGDQGPFENHWASIGLNTNLLFDIPLSKNNDKVSFGIGFSHQYMNIRHNQKLMVNDSAGYTNFVAMDSTDIFHKGILAGNSFSIPLEFRFRTGGWRHFKVHIGGKIGYQANMYGKYVSKVDGRRIATKAYGFPDQNDLLYSAHIRIGMRNWAIFASYNFNTLFKHSESPQLNLLQMGLSVSLL